MDFKILCIKKNKNKNKFVCCEYQVPTHKNLEECANHSYNLSACGAMPRGSSPTSFTWKAAEALIKHIEKVVGCE